jgi:hypothetical protein
MIRARGVSEYLRAVSLNSRRVNAKQTILTPPGFSGRIREMENRMRRMTTPKHLGAEGSAFWKEMVGEHDITDTARVALLTRAAECLDRIAEARAEIAKTGLTVVGAAGARINPACRLEKEARDGFLAAMRALRLGADGAATHSGLPRRGPGRPPLPFGWAGPDA